MERSRWTYLLALQRGVEVAGSEVRLAWELGISLSYVRAYLNGGADVPVEVFLKVVDFLYPRPSIDARPATSMHEGGLPWRIAESSEAGFAGTPPWLSHPFFAPDFLPKDRHELLDAALDAAMSIAGTDLGNIQLLDSTGDLRIQAQQGFFRPFLTFFDRVSGPDSACGAALNDCQQVFVEDVMSDPIFVGHESGRIVLDAGVRAVTSSPIVNEYGWVVGMLSTHHRQPQTAASVDLRAQRGIAQRLARHLLVR